jgi:hypothetical protein
MTIAAQVKARIKSRLETVVQAAVRKAIRDLLPLMPQLLEFQKSPETDRQSYYDHTKDPQGNLAVYARLKDRLGTLGIPVEEVDIDIADFERWCKQTARLRRHYQRDGTEGIHRCLQHYLVSRVLKIGPGDVYIDIGAQQSPFAAILNRRGVRAYRLDLAYGEGIRGIDIGADGADTKLPDGFASALSIQDAFQHFAGDADTRFVKEAARVLNGKGRFGIIPLYVDDTSFVAVNPFCDVRRLPRDPDAKTVWREDGVEVDFARHYSPESFKRRIYAHVPETMTGRVLYFRNLGEVMQRYPGQTIYSFFMFYCERCAPSGKGPRDDPRRLVNV